MSLTDNDTKTTTAQALVKGPTRRKTLFVTVGTTLFEALIQSTTTPEALDWMCANGYTHLIVQYGKGTRPTLSEKYYASSLSSTSTDNATTASGMTTSTLSIELYSFKSSLQDDMLIADTIISHAGAGTVMEALRMKKQRLIVVINTLLMDNHQIELATALEKRKYLFVVDDANQLLFQKKQQTIDQSENHSNDNIDNRNIWNDIERFEATIYPGSNEYDVPRIVNHFFGFDRYHYDDTDPTKKED